MTSWIIVIRKENPEHWAIAQRVGFWDMLKEVEIEPDDVLYFWQSGGSFVGRVRATRAGRPLTATDSHPWNDSVVYKSRVELADDFERPLERLRWSDFESRLGRRVPLRGHVPRFDGAEERELDRLFPERAAADVPRFRDEERRAEMAALGWDQREFDLRAIDRRLGQPAFRQELLRAYGGRCAVTGTSTSFVLEAAHISPYKGAQTNRVYNGLLLRSDIHTLFDRLQLTVTPDLVVRVHPDTSLAEYHHLNGRSLLANLDDVDRPHEDLLRQHNQLCGWLSKS